MQFKRSVLFDVCVCARVCTPCQPESVKHVLGDNFENYVKGAPVLGDGCVSYTTDLGCANLAPVLMPTASADGACTETQQLPYLSSLAPYQCPLAASSDLASLCATTLNASHLARVAIATAPTANAPKLALQFSVATEASPQPMKIVTQLA